MSKKLVFFLSILLSYGNYITAQTSDDQAVAEAVEKLRKVMITPDEVILKSLVADDLVYVHSSGTVRNKQGFVDEFMKGWSVFKSIKLENQSITLAGDAAVVRHRLTGDFLHNNIDEKIDIIILMVWQKQQGQWKLLARQAAKIPK